MSIELDWHEGDETAALSWETETAPLPAAPAPPATIVRGQRARGGAPDWLPRFLVSILAGILLGLAILAGVLFWRSGQGNEQARQDIGSAASLALDAWKNRDIGLYSDLLDGSDTVWKSRMIAGLRSMPPPDAIAVDKVTLNGSWATAWVTETNADGSALHKLAFFRLADGQWRLAPPQPDSFGATVTEQTPHFRISVRERDEEFLPNLVNLAEGAYVTLCGELRCNDTAQPLSLRLAYEYTDASATLAPGQMSILSPWVTGWKAPGRPADVFEQELTRQMAMQLVLSKAPHTVPSVRTAIGDWAAAELAGAALPGVETLAPALQKGTLLSLDFVWRQATTQPYLADPLVKAQLHTMLAFARATLGDDAIGQLLEAGAGPLNVVLQRAFEADAATFSQEWLRWLNATLTSVSPQAG